jgi:hypothetical protein
MRETLSIKFGEDGTYFNVELENVEPFTEETIGESRVKRRKWGEVLIKNYPYKYRTDATSKNKLFDEIMAKSPVDYIFIKHEAENGDVTEGYFGIVDCDIDDTQQKNIKVTPAILDQYTDFLENYDTKIDIFGADNLVENSDFGLSVGGIPVAWDYPISASYTPPRVDTFLNKKAGVLRCRGIFDNGDPDDPTDGQMSQTIGTVQLFRNIDISFYFALIEYWNGHPLRQNLKFRISVTNPYQTIYANAEGGWGSTETFIPYAPNKLPLPIGSISGYEYFRMVLDPPTTSGFLNIAFYHFRSDLSTDVLIVPDDLADGDVYYEADLYITEVNVAVLDLVYGDIAINLNEEDLVIRKQNRIEREDGSFYANEFSAYPRKSLVDDWETANSKDFVEIYFDINGEPDMSPLGDDNLGMRDANGTNYQILQQILDDEPEHKFYKGELCELEIFQGETIRIWPFQDVIIRGVAKFAREEIYSKLVYTQQDSDDGLIPSGKSIGDYKPPEEGVGWAETSEFDEKLGKLWVRKPFNEAAATWALGDVNTTEGVNEYGTVYYKSLKSVKQYPVSSSSVTVTTSVELKGIFKRLYNGSHPSLKKKEVYSTFLWNDYPAGDKTDALLVARPRLVGTPNLNYVTGEDNFLDQISALHTFDLKTEKTIEDNDARLELSFKELFDDFRIQFPYLYFFVDSDKNLHIEHEMYEDLTNSYIDIRNTAESYQRWKYLKDKMFATYDFTSVNSGYKDFRFSKVEFAKIVSNKRETDFRSSEATKYLTSDIQYCLENPDDLQNGLILIHYDEVNGSKVIRNAQGKISGRSVPSGDLSIANMLYKFGTYEGTWEDGTINGEAVTFEHTKYTQEATDEIELKGIYDQNYYLTDIGIGFAKTKKIDYKNGIITVSLLYRYNDWYIIVEQDNIIQM